MPPKVKMLPVNEIAKLIREHNKLSKIDMPKGKERTRANLIKAIEDSGYTLNHEKKRIDPKKGYKPQVREKTNPKKDASKEPKQIKMSIKPPMQSMKINPPLPKPTNLKQLRQQMNGLLKNLPVEVKKYKAEAKNLSTLKEQLKAKRKYIKPFNDKFTKLFESIEDTDWWEKAEGKNEDLFDNLDNEFDKKLNKGFDNALEETKKGLKEVSLKDIATKRMVRFTKVEDIKKYFRDFKDKYMDEGKSTGVSGSLREKYIQWIADNEKTLIKDLQAMNKGGQPKLPARPSVKKPIPKKLSKKEATKELGGDLPKEDYGGQSTQSKPKTNEEKEKEKIKKTEASILNKYNPDSFNLSKMKKKFYPEFEKQAIPFYKDLDKLIDMIDKYNDKSFGKDYKISDDLEIMQGTFMNLRKKYENIMKKGTKSKK